MSELEGVAAELADARRELREVLLMAGEWARWRAADVLGISDRAVRKACADGRLDTELVDGQWRITRASVEAYEPRRSTR
jgi:hypothetical protein